MGPLHGMRILQIAGLGPVPFAGMLLADLGADVVRVDRPGEAVVGDPRSYALGRGRRSVVLDLKRDAGREIVLSLVRSADALIEGHRAGVMERLGLGPDVCLARNSRLVYGRQTGWGQDGPLAPRAGHDLNYLALSGALHNLVGADGTPITPPPMVADLGGGGMLLALGVVSAVLSARTSGQGQVIDSAMVDGAALLTMLIHSMLAQGRWSDTAGQNFADGAAPYYGTYRTRDDRFVAVGAIEAKFYAALLTGLGLDADSLADRDDRANWSQLKQTFAAVFATRTMGEWEEVFAGTDACVTPVLTPTEAPEHPHNRARETFVTRAGVVQPAPAPRFGATPTGPGSLPPVPGEHSRDVLVDWGLEAGRVDSLVADGIVQSAG